MKTKICSKCGEVKSLDCFYKNKANKDGLESLCKLCKKAYCQANSVRITEKGKAYYQANKAAHSARSKSYHKRHRDALNAKKKVRYLNDREERTARMKIYQLENKQEIAAQKKTYKNSPATTKIWLERIPFIDKPLFENGQVTVECKNCHKRFAPIKSQINSRRAAWEGTCRGECNFYCSDSCRDACPLYRFQPKQTDPKSALYIPKTEQQKARNCQTNHLKELQIDETGNTYCEKCGAIGPVDLHHTATIQKNGMQAVSSAGHILLCKNCHINLHKECGK